MADKPQGKPRRAENEYKKPRIFTDDAGDGHAPVVESKSWDEHEMACRILLKKAEGLQTKLEGIVKDWADFETAAAVAYKKMPQSDAMFSDSPLSPFRMQSAFRQNLAKLGWKWAAGLPWGPENVRTFLTVATEACTWGKRIIKDKERLEKIETAEKAARKAQDDIGAIL